MKKQSVKRRIWRWGCSALIAAAMLTASGTAAYGTALYFEESDNLLVNPNWEDGLAGWSTAAMDEPDTFHGESILRSCVYQDVSLEGIASGQDLQLSGNLAAALDDPTQLFIEMSLSVCDENNEVIASCMASEQEAGREAAYHEIVLEIPPEAAYARVSLTIYKQSTVNTMRFEQLCLKTVPDDTGDTYSVRNLNIPDDAVLWDGHYYYYYDNADISWTMAQNYCLVNHGSLAVISSEEEQAVLEQAFPGTGGWIGATDPETGEGKILCFGTEDRTGYYCEWDSDTVTYERAGKYGGVISEETRALLETGKGYYYGTCPEGYDIAKAWDCFSDATEEYSAEAWYYLGRIMASGQKDTGKDAAVRAMGAYEKAVEYGFPLGWIGQADLYLAGQGVPADYQRAMQLYQRAADLGCPEAFCGIGTLYQFGFGVEADAAAALDYYQEAAGSEEFGCRNMAKNAIGDLYFEGCGEIAPDYAKAMEWFLSGAREGFGPCCNQVGYLYYNGYGTDQDLAQAAYWFEQAAVHGELDGCCNIAYLYENGKGVAQDYALALHYYKMAAIMGDVSSMFKVGHMYEEGLGTDEDPVLAREWYGKVLESSDADEELKKTARESLERIQSETAATTYADPDYASGNYTPDQGYNMNASDWNPDPVYDYSVDPNDYLYPDGTLDLSAFGINPDGTFDYNFGY